MAELNIPLPRPGDSADDIIEVLDLRPHPEGGYYRETWRDRPAGGGRGAGTAIYFLLPGGVENRWHRVDAAEIWHYYAGAPLALEIAPEGGVVSHAVLGASIFDGERPQIEVPPRAWQRARSLGPWTLVGCTVSPAFEFERFEIAPDGWRPHGAARPDERL
ncbi:MAG: cupin domain-containing protein [Planctomycetota bacterium]